MGEHVNPASTAILLKSERDLETVDGRTYRLRFGTNACAAIEERFHLGEEGQPYSILELLGHASLKGARGLRAIVRYLLEQHHGDEIGNDEQTEKRVGDIMDALQIKGQLFVEIVCAFHGMTPKQLEQAADDARKRAARRKARGKEDPVPEGEAAAGQPTS